MVKTQSVYETKVIVNLDKLCSLIYGSAVPIFVFRLCSYMYIDYIVSQLLFEQCDLVQLSIYYIINFHSAL